MDKSRKVLLFILQMTIDGFSPHYKYPRCYAQPGDLFINQEKTRTIFLVKKFKYLGIISFHALNFDGEIVDIYYETVFDFELNGWYLISIREIFPG